MNTRKRCPHGHIYEGDTCPYCRTELYPNAMETTTTLYDETVVQKTKPTVYSNDETASIPLCPHCGRPVRKEIKHYQFIGSIEGNAFDGKTPWNFGWKGKCENCGYDFSISMTQKIDSPYNNRQTIVRVSKCIVQAMGSDGFILHDAFVGLSGIEIEQRNNIDGVKKTFISTNELKYLINALKDSPILAQLDWNEDKT